MTFEHDKVTRMESPKRTRSQELFIVGGHAVHGAEVGERRHGVRQCRRFAVGAHGLGELKVDVGYVTKNWTEG